MATQGFGFGGDLPFELRSQDGRMILLPINKPATSKLFHLVQAFLGILLRFIGDQRVVGCSVEKVISGKNMEHNYCNAPLQTCSNESRVLIIFLINIATIKFIVKDFLRMLLGPLSDVWVVQSSVVDSSTRML